MRRLKRTRFALLSLFAFSGCGLPEPVADLMDSPPAGEGSADFSAPEYLERINAATVHKEQPPPL